MKNMNFLQLIGMSLISPNKMIDEVLNEKSEPKLIQSLLYALLIFASLAYIAIYAELGDLSEIYLQLKIGYMITFFGFLQTNLLTAFIVVLIYLSAGIWLLPTLVFTWIRNKNLQKERRSYKKMVELSILSLTPFLVMENISIVLIMFKLSVLSQIKTVGDYLIFGGVILTLFYFIIMLIIACNRTLLNDGGIYESNAEKSGFNGVNVIIFIVEFIAGFFIILLMLGVLYI